MVLTDKSFEQAKQKKLLSLKNNNVYVEKTNIGQKCISTRWICTLKNTPEGTIHKKDLLPEDLKKQIKKICQKTHPPVVQTLSDLS